MSIAVIYAALLLVTHAGTSQSLSFESVNYHVYEIDPSKEALQLVWKDAHGNPYHNLIGAERALQAQGKRLRFITNAGIYKKANGINTGYQPEGLHIEDGKELIPLNTSTGTGNFYLQPNGVFFLGDDGKAGVEPTSRYARTGRKPRLACQSGPLLVDRGSIHPKLNPQGTSKRLRNGVGVREDGTIIFAITASGEVVNFHGFARFFRDVLQCPSALYLDGDIWKMAVDPAKDAIDPTGVFAAMFAIWE